MKFLIVDYKDKQEKEDIQKQGLYCYDLRHSDDGAEIATIEKRVLVNRIGSIITNNELIFDNNDFMDFEEFVLENLQVETIEELLDSKPIKAQFNTKIASDMKHNGEIVEILDFFKGKDIYNDRYTMRFNDGTINNNIMSGELDFDFKRNKINKKTLNKACIKERGAR